MSNKIYKIEFSFNGKTFRGSVGGVSEKDAVNNLKEKIKIISVNLEKCDNKKLKYTRKFDNESFNAFKKTLTDMLKDNFKR